MTPCLGSRLDGDGWSGLPLGRFTPPGHRSFEAVASMQLTLFAWREGASPATVRSFRGSRHYRRGDGVLDLMATGQQAHVAHDRADAPGDCLLVALPVDDDRRLAELGLRRAPTFTSRFGFADPLLHSLAAALLAQCIAGEPLGRLYTDSISDALLAHVVARYADPSAAAAAVRPVSDAAEPGLSKIQRAILMEYLDAHLGHPIALDDLAGSLQYGRAQFVRLFRKTFSTSPHQYVMRQRIEYAKRLLQQGDRPIAEIAAACGFADQSHFGNTFARIVGVPPGRWTKRLTVKP